MSMTDPAVADTGNGFIVGADPKQPPVSAATAAAAQQETMASNAVPTINPVAPAPESTPAVQVVTLDDHNAALAAARQEEKDKLYGRLNTIEEELKSERERKAAEEKARQDAIAAAEEEARRKEEEVMDARQLLERKDAEWRERFTAVEGELARRDAIDEMERKLSELEGYKRDRLAQESEFIMPELHDLVGGDSMEAIDASIESMKLRTQAILDQIIGHQEAQQQQLRQSARVAAPTAPPVGPMEQQEQYESLTPDDIRSMDMETYKRHRDQLKQATSRLYTGR